MIQELTQIDYDKLVILIKLQLNKFYIKHIDVDDFIQEVMLYLLKRKGIIDVNDPYIYGDIHNGIYNYFQKYIKNEKYVHLSDNVIDSTKTYADYNMIGIILDLREYKHGLLFIDYYFKDICVADLCVKYKLTKSQIYYRLNNIKNKINNDL